YQANFSVSFYDATTFQTAEQLELLPSESASGNEALDPEILARLQKRLDFVYPFQTATQTTTNQTASEIKRFFEDPSYKEQGQLIAAERPRTEIHRFVQQELAKPQFLQQEQTKVSPAAIG